MIEVLWIITKILGKYIRCNRTATAFVNDTLSQNTYKCKQKD